MKKRFFTLIELMGVIFIIILLIGLVSSIIPRARERVRRTRCANNLRNIGHAVERFATEHNGQYPFGIFADNQKFYGANVNYVTTNSTRVGLLPAMKVALKYYLGNSPDKIWICPSSPGGDEQYAFHIYHILPADMSGRRALFRDSTINHTNPEDFGHVLFGDGAVRGFIEEEWKYYYIDDEPRWLWIWSVCSGEPNERF